MLFLLPATYAFLCCLSVCLLVADFCVRYLVPFMHQEQLRQDLLQCGAQISDSVINNILTDNLDDRNSCENSLTALQGLEEINGHKYVILALRSLFVTA